jgi:hypothetical protein
MNDAERIEYLEGKVQGMERLCMWLFTFCSQKSPGVIALMPDLIKGIRDELLIDHPGLFSTPLGNGIDDAMADISAKLRQQ